METEDVVYDLVQVSSRVDDGGRGLRMHDGDGMGVWGWAKPLQTRRRRRKFWAQEPFYCMFASLLSGCVMLAKPNIMGK